jgi:hypothetical protein
MDQTRKAKRIFESKSEGSEKLGRHRLKCLEDEENDLQELKLERRTQKTNNRKN